MKLGIGGFCTTIVGSLNCAPVVTIQNFISEGGNLLTSINVGALSSFSGRGTGKCIYNKRKSASGAEKFTTSKYSVQNWRENTLKLA